MGAEIGNQVLVEVPEALQGLNAIIYFLPIILTMIVFMTARLNLGSAYSVYILIGTIVSFFVFKFISDKIILARTKDNFFDSKVLKILK